MSRIDVSSFGAVGDGVTDDTEAVQDALDQAKGLPGSEVYFPRGQYRITQSLNVTYSGVAAGLHSEYYGFAIVGQDKFNTLLVGETDGTPLLDFTGKTRMTMRDIGLAQFNSSTPRSSCALLLARNLNNGFAGGHSFERVTFRGYFGKTVVQSASSEGNVWHACNFEIWSDGASCFEHREQLTNGINSEYIDLSGHVMAGGNTASSFSGCFWTSLGQDSVPCITVQGSENTTFIGCYTKNNTGSIMRLDGKNSLLHMLNHRDESQGALFVEFSAGSTTEAMEVTGRSSRGLWGGDNSKVDRSKFDLGFLAGVIPLSVDLYDFERSYLGYVTVGVSIRHSMKGSSFASSL